MSEFLAYRIPDQAIKKMSGQFDLIEQENMPKNCFILSNFNQNKQYVFVPSEQDFEKTFKPHFTSEEPKVISKEKYISEGERIVEFLKNKSMNKFVFSRIKKTDFDASKCIKLFDALCESYPNAFVYLISSKSEGTWIGATPETLLQRFNSSGFTMSLAGTKEKSNQEWSPKEYNEQDLVSSYILETLTLNGIQNIEQNGPYDSEAAHLIHLRTDFSFDLSADETLSMANKLHPTPAVSGLPKTESIALINQIENHELGYSRSLYSGYLGNLGEQTSQLYVNLRCCQIFRNAAYLYIGGGYTEDSSPIDEWRETESKGETLISIMEKL